MDYFNTDEENADIAAQHARLRPDFERLQLLKAEARRHRIPPDDLFHAIHTLRAELRQRTRYVVLADVLWNTYDR